MTCDQVTRLAWADGKSAWRDRAACLGLTPELFFPEKDEGNTWHTTNQAKRVCASCPVRSECLEFALEHERDHGVFGGMTVTERRQELKRRMGVTPRLDAPFAALVFEADRWAGVA